jgi:hypothetical protein
MARYHGGKRVFHNEESMKGWIHSHLISDNALIPKSESTPAEVENNHPRVIK